MVNHITHIQRS